MLLAARLTGWKGQQGADRSGAALEERGLADVRYVLAATRRGATAMSRDIDARIQPRGPRRRRAQGRPLRRHAGGACSPRASSPCPRPRPKRSAAARSKRRRWGRWWSSRISAPRRKPCSPPPAWPEERTGWRVPPGDADALAEALAERADARRHAREAIARRARAHVEAKFSLETMTDDTLPRPIWGRWRGSAIPLSPPRGEGWGEGPGDYSLCRGQPPSPSS